MVAASAVPPLLTKEKRSKGTHFSGTVNFFLNESDKFEDIAILIKVILNYNRYYDIENFALAAVICRA